MKKLLCLMMALLLLLSLSACGGEEPLEKEAYSLLYKGQTIKIDSAMSNYLNALGASAQYQEMPTCGKGDLDKLYDYGSIRLRTYQINGVDYISVIELMDDLVQTTEGLSIGDAQQKVSEIYGVADRTTASAWIYETKGMDLEFHFHADNTVKSIVYRGEN